MKRTIAIAVAAAVLGTSAVTVTPMPAKAWLPFVVPMLMAKEDKNFKAVNPYAPAKAHKRMKKKKKM